MGTGGERAGVSHGDECWLEPSLPEQREEHGMYPYTRSWFVCLCFDIVAVEPLIKDPLNKGLNNIF